MEEIPPHRRREAGLIHSYKSSKSSHHRERDHDRDRDREKDPWEKDAMASGDGRHYYGSGETSTQASRSERKHGGSSRPYPAESSRADPREARRSVGGNVGAVGEERQEREHRRHGHGHRDRGDGDQRRPRGEREHRDHYHHHRRDRDRDRDRDRGRDRDDTAHGDDNAREIDPTERPSDVRPLQIAQRIGAGKTYGSTLKILGSSSHQSSGVRHNVSKPDAAEADDIDDSGGPKKVQAFVTPAPTPLFSRCQLMDDSWHVCVDQVHGSLLENSSEFTVIACIGAQGAGKSTALSLLVASLRGASAPPPAKADDVDASGLGKQSSHVPSTQSRWLAEAHAAMVAAGGTNKNAGSDADVAKHLPLPIHNIDSFMEGATSPVGVDLCVSNLDRLLLLDAQPKFNCDATSKFDPEQRSELYLFLFLMSICHTLLVVMDTPVDLQLLKVLRLLATVKLKVPDLAEWIARQRNSADKQNPLDSESDVLPRLVVAFNNVDAHLDNYEVFRPSQTYLTHSPWAHARSVHYVRLPTLPGNSPCEMLASDNAHHAGMQLRERVLCCGPGRGQFGKDGVLQLTEREWLYNLSAYWEFVQKVQILEEYFTVASEGLENYGWPDL